MPSEKGGKVLRCAVYTRKSTEHGLELEFNSLDAQREACEAYIRSQASEGWRLIPTRYDDPAYSGGNLDRPGVQALLKDIAAGLIDVVVVYKIDRLTRSLADFAKLVELFDAKSVSFVAITQQFNTTTSMGRLTLNVLLSFAQFERELASERVRDKVAASRRKGKWTGGSVPLGYDSKDKRLVVNTTEAKTVRLIFERYLALKSFQSLIDELNDAGVVTKRRQVAGRIAGGIPFTYGPLAYLLKNRTYLGETGHGGKWFAGEHEPIIAPGTFDAVQELLKANSAGRTGRRERVGALLTGLLYDDRGNRMSPSYSVKNGIRYPFYVSSALLRGRKERVGSVPRVSAREIEAAVLQAVCKSCDQCRASESDANLTPRELLERRVHRIEIYVDRLVITLKASEGESAIQVAWSTDQKRNLAATEGAAERGASPGPSPALVQSIVRAHRWLKLLCGGSQESVESLATAVNVHPKVLRSRIKLAFLAPTITKSLLAGPSPERQGLEQLNEIAALSWIKQNQRFAHLTTSEGEAFPQQLSAKTRFALAAGVSAGKLPLPKASPSFLARPGHK